MVKRRRIALVGAGHISKKHISAINTLESKLDHVAICENNLEISSQLSLSKDVALFHDYTEMINNCDIDNSIESTMTNYIKQKIEGGTRANQEGSY